MRSGAAQSPRWFSPAAAVLSGLLLALAFPPFEWVVLLPLAMVPWIVALVREKSRSRALLSGVLFGLAYWCASIPWIVYVVTHYGGQSSAMGIVCLLLLAAILAEWPAIVAWAVVALGPPGSTRRLAAFPLLWMATEHARSFVYGGFPWNLIGHALYRHPIWLQSAAVWGVYGVGALVVSVSALLAAAAVRRRPAPLFVAALVVLAVGGAGAARLALREHAGTRISVALLQPNVTEEDRLQDASKSYASVIGQARLAAREATGLIVIPESALPVTWDHSPTLRRDLSAIADSGPLILFNDIEEVRDGRYYNVARLLLSGERLASPYRKVHLVPFGEYVPLPKLFFFVRQVSTRIGAFASAQDPMPVEGGGLRIGVGVCYEIIYPELAREEVVRGANLLTTISNDSWYGRAGAQAQHLAGATLRAVETSRYLLRAAITGISAIVDEKGRIVGEIGENQEGILRGTAWVMGNQTAWTRWGFWLPRLSEVAAGAVLLFGVARWWKGRRARVGSFG
jgi:apolipoprotein N-acyltransferase